MPQIYMIINDRAKKIIMKKIDLFAPELVSRIEKTLGIDGLNDVALTIPSPVLYTYGEKDIQIEIRYTAGKDEYNQGKPFEISAEKQVKINQVIKKIFFDFFTNYHDLLNGSKSSLSISIWYKPYYQSCFEIIVND